MKIRCFKGIALLLSLLMLTAMMPVFAESIYGPVEIVSGERTLTFTEMPTRVISLEDHFTEELLALGLRSTLSAAVNPTLTRSCLSIRKRIPVFP